jgi:hypothetical protein
MAKFEYAEAMHEELIRLTKEEDVPVADIVAFLLEKAEDLILQRLFDCYCEQDNHLPDTTSADLAAMRRLASKFAAQAAHLVQPRLVGSRWSAPKVLPPFDGSHGERYMM